VVVLGDLDVNVDFIGIEAPGVVFGSAHAICMSKTSRLVVPLSNAQSIVEGRLALGDEQALRPQAVTLANTPQAVKVVGVATIWDAIEVVFPHSQIMRNAPARESQQHLGFWPIEFALSLFVASVSAELTPQ